MPRGSTLFVPISVQILREENYNILEESSLGRPSAQKFPLARGLGRGKGRRDHSTIIAVRVPVRYSLSQEAMHKSAFPPNPMQENRI
jgi:hypothetical protein